MESSLNFIFLLRHAAELSRRLGSMDLYGKQAIEAWYWFHSQNASRFTAEIELLSRRRLMISMMLKRVAADTVRRLRSLFHERLCECATRPDDQRRQEKNPGRQLCRSVTEKAEKDGRSWTEKQFEAALKRPIAHGGGAWNSTTAGTSFELSRFLSSVHWSTLQRSRRW